MTLRLIVCGSRDTRDTYDLQTRILDAAWRRIDELEADVVEVIHGDCRGADRIAADCLKDIADTMWVFPADWEKHGKAAGHIRNEEMLEFAMVHTAEVIAVVNFPPTRGTSDMIRKAEKAGVRVTVVHPG